MAQVLPFERITMTGATQQRSTMYVGGNDGVFSRLPHCDLLTFIAMVQKMVTLPLFHHIPVFQSGTVRRGASGAVHIISVSGKEGIAYKRFHITRDFTEEDTYRALVCEILVLEHPTFKRHPNIQTLLGVAWDVQQLLGVPYRVMPVLVFKQAEHGNLYDYMDSEVPFLQRVRLCIDIGEAIKAMHSFSMRSSFSLMAVMAELTSQ